MYIPLIPRSAGALALTLMAFGLGFPLAATADTPQRLSATVDGKLFEKSGRVLQRWYACGLVGAAAVADGVRVHLAH